MTHVGHDSRSSSKPGQGQPAVGANLIPATLDLAERARLAVNAMTEATNPEEDYRVYWKVTFRSNPPIMYHDFSDTGIAAKFMESPLSTHDRETANIRLGVNPRLGPFGKAS